MSAQKTAKAPTAKTPTIAISRALRAIGLKQGKDFKVEGRYQGKGKNRERVATDVLVLGREADELVAEHADAIEAAVEADGGWTFNVSVYYVDGRERPMTSITNVGSRVRQTPPNAAPALLEETPAPAEADGQQPVTARGDEDAKAYMAGRLHAYLVESKALADDTEAGKEVQIALETAEMQTWTGGTSAWVSGSKATLLAVARGLYDLAGLVSTGTVTAAKAGANAKAIEKAAVRFAEAAEAV
ncbi:hypothetical protein ACIRPQ_28930 [Streptomyces sp. NPDC101213]|uniref:hypothetical protein n=1 Tax=Streptomyces sp. NPDC101213 TaxID=3366130 RepID=UPI0038189DA8